MLVVLLVSLVGSPLLAAAATAPAEPKEAESRAVAPAPAVIEAPAESAAPAVRRPLRIAVYELSSSGVEPRAASLFTESLLAEIRKLQRTSALSLDEVKAMLDLEAQRQLAGCEESSCLAEIAEALGADALIVGGIATIGDTSSIALKRISPQTSSVVQSYTQQLVYADGEELLAAVGPAVAELFPELPLKIGQTRGVAPELALRLNPPPLPPWAFWTTAGIAGAGVGASIGAGAWWALSDSTFRATLDGARTKPVPAVQVRQEQETLALANTVFWAVAGATLVGAIAAGVMVPFTDWNGVGGDL